MTEETAALSDDITLGEAAAKLRMSTRWLRDRIKADKLEHQKYGHKILFTVEQVEAIRARYRSVPVEQSVTTGRKKKSAGAA